MDKRTLFFVLSLSLTLFLINLFFEYQKSEDNKISTQQQLAKKEETLKKLSADVKKRTASPSLLPLVMLYSDSEGKNELTVAVQSQDAILTIAWDKNLPSKVFSKSISEDNQIKPLILATPNMKLGEPVIYHEEEGAMLPIGELPELGKYEVQIVVPRTIDNRQSFDIYLGDYVDGVLSIPALKILSLKHEIDKKEKSELPTIGEGVALIKSNGRYLPTAMYNSPNKLLEPLDALSEISSLVSKPKDKETFARKKGQEEFYVLQNPYQQLVFSSYGGALVEINLPFESKSDQDSVVKEIQFDRDMVDQHPYNAHFPAHAYFTPGIKAEGPFEKHKEGKLGGYYPLLRRDLIEKDKKKSVRILPRYYGLNIVSEYPEIAELVYEVKSFTNDHIVFEAIQGYRRITKTFSISNETQAPYTIDLTIDIEGDSKGLWLTSGIPEVEWISGAAAPSIKYRVTRNKSSDVESVDLKKNYEVTSTYIDWLSNSNGFFGMILDPLEDTDPGYRTQIVSGSVVPSRLIELDDQYHQFKADNLPGYMSMLPLRSNGGEMHFRIFAGPFSSKVLKTVDSVYTNSATGYNPDYIASQTFHGWFSFISEPFAKFLFVLMNFFHYLTNSWALSIVLLTVALRFMLYPLNAWSTKSMVQMQQIAPEVAALQERYKKDPKKAQMEILNLYRERGVNPVSSCLPLLIQMPFLIGMFDLLKSTFELRGASFIPGWIDDLTAPDVLFSWQTPLPLIGNQFHLLPILLGAVMYLQQRLMSTAPKDPSLMTEQQKQQKFMGNIMSVVFTVMFYSFPSGLNIYWLSSMLLGMLQQYMTTKRLSKQALKPVEVVVSTKGKKR